MNILQTCIVQDRHVFPDVFSENQSQVALDDDHKEHNHKLYFYVMNFKGDWKYIKQVFLLTKDASREKAGKTGASLK